MSLSQKKSQKKKSSLGIVLPSGDAQSDRIEPLNEFSTIYFSLIKANSSTKSTKKDVIQ